MMATHKEKAEDLLKNFTDELINQIENNNAPWQVPWSPTEHNFTLPVNKEGTLYQGRNMMLLLSSAIKNGYTDDRWYTFNAAKELGVKVKKGEKASQIVRWQYIEERLKLDENGKKIIGEDGKPIKEIHRLDFPKGPFIHYVFNANQIEGLAPKEPPKRLEAWERHEMAENIIKNAQKDGIDIVHRAIDRAYYNPEKDQIVMPERHQFATADLYYATLLHEIGHATGHEKRLNRDLSGGFSSESYAKEELRAEISSMIIGQTLQIGHDTTQHQSYLKSWVKIVKEDPNAIFEAVKEAEKIKDYVLGLNKELNMEKAQEFVNEEKSTIFHHSSNNTTKSVNIIFEVPQAVQEKFDKDVERLDATLASYPEPVKTKIPPVLLALDGKNDLSVQDLPLNLDRFTLHKMQGKTKARQDDSHSLSLDDVKQVLKEIYDPVVVLQDKNGQSLVIITTMKAKNGSTIITPIHLQKTKGSYVFHDLATSFGKENFENWIGKRLDNIIYYNKEKNLEYGTLPHYWLDNKTVGVVPNKALDEIILNPNDIVKRYNEILEKNLQKTEQLKGLSMPNNQTERDYIYAPYEDKDKVKELGAKYDPDVKMWYVPEGIDKAKFSQWTTKPQAEYASAELEFKKFLQSFGADIPAGHPIADGKWHSLHIQGDKSNSKKGGYIATEENGVWRGSFNNFKTGQTAYFSSKSHSHTFTPPEEIERIQRERAEAQAKLYAHTAQSAQKILAVAQPATDYPYLTKKGVQAHGLYIVPQPETAVQDGNIRIARDWREAKSMRENFKENGDRISVLTAGDLMIPAYDKDGNISTIQTIGRDKNSFKSFLTDGQKAGSFLVLGQPKNNEAILIAEGYATAATLYEQLNKPVIVAFDAGNLKSVALTVREHFPDSILYMAADNDHKTAREREALGHTSNLNTGIEKATEAAVAVGGYVVAPKFSEHDSGSDWNDVLKDKGVVELRDQFRTQLVDIGLQRNLDLSIKKVEFADKEIQRVQETVMLTAFKDKDKIIKDYALHEKTFEGRYIASDMMKEMFSQYSQSQETRNKHNNAVHNTAAALAAKHFNDMLDKPIENGRDTVVFLTGSPGAGKTTTVLNKGQLKDNVAVVFEGQLANAHQNPASIDKIQKALERGFKVEIVAVNPLPEQALDNTFKRFYDPADGRGSSIATMARIQGNTYDGLKAVHNTFGDSVGLTIIDKPNGNNGKVEYTGWQHLDVLKSQRTEAQIKERLTTHLIKQYEIGVINDECFKQAAGSEHKQLAERMAERGSRAFSQDESRREFSSGSGSTSNQLGERENARTSGETGRMGGSTSQLSETESGLHRPHRQPANAIGRGGSEPARAGGTYTGHIISVGDDITLQKTGTGKIIVHQTKDLPGIQEQDTSSKLKIVYGANGKGDIASKANDLEIGKEKEMGLGGGGKP